MRPVYLAAVKRTPVAARNGALSDIDVTTLAGMTIRALLAEAGCDPDQVEGVVMGNALYGGGNPARVAALAAGLAQRVPAMTLDTQCCSGLDAIWLAATAVGSGHCDLMVAGGLESYSRAPIRQTRPRQPDERPQTYLRPPFTPWPDRDPDMLASAAAVARELGIDRTAQAEYAIASHGKALTAALPETECLAINGVTADPFGRRLSMSLCDRLPVIAGDRRFGVTSATVAVEADAAAAVIVTSQVALDRIRSAHRPVRIRMGLSGGDDPTRPALAPIKVTQTLLQKLDIAAADLAVAEVMEAFAVQAMACVQGIGLDPEIVNRSGGALARGHPIGASGAVLATRLWHEMQAEPPGSLGLALIAAAGGLGTGLVVEAT
ncbi:thiolase family protein [Aestuariivita sp.]|jgi:acetyl-CoA C-acetyltransferase|uniref:thiolase family protein n=1 Tax=Aestuariivita sp. TaxID=1872407 RepID=UPI00216F75F0|nr:thiolase family protein [Aestuariivita sp.]MCE8009307.1 thiolase family protein [Aestuariivita sp.]